jgi:glycosyltransferase involved in cell wall biosynthesis
MKVPLAATDLGGAVEILDNGNCGLLVPHSNPKKAADMINNYYKDDKLKTSNTKKAIEHSTNIFHLHSSTKTY